MNYRERLRSLREDRDLSQADLGKVLNKSQQGYSHIENGRAELKIYDLILLCRFYNISADYLIGLIGKPRPQGHLISNMDAPEGFPLRGSCHRR